jgi:GntR family transcriptional regulator
MEQYGASRIAVRNALNVLQAEGIVRPVKRAGLIVRSPGERRRLTRGSLVTRSPNGYVFPAATGPNEKWQTHGTPVRSWEPVPTEVADVLGVETNIEVLRRRRVMSPAGEPPYSVVDSWVHPDVVADAPRAGEISPGPGGYLDRIEEAGHGPLTWTETIRTRMPSREEAALLESPPGLPVFTIQTTMTSARTGRPAVVQVSVVPSDRLELVSELRRDKSARWPVTPVGEGEPR